MFDGVRMSIGSEDRYMKDWMYLEGVREIEFVGNRRDLLYDVVWANEAML